MMMRRTFAVAAILSATLSSTTLLGQAAAITPRVKPQADDVHEHRADVRIDTTEVRIPVSVTLAQSGKLQARVEFASGSVCQGLAGFSS